MTGKRKLSVIAVLVLSTLLWGTAVAAHQHWGGDVEHCETCLLPHAAHIPAHPEFTGIPQQRGISRAFSDQSHTSSFIPFYHGRAPPL